MNCAHCGGTGTFRPKDGPPEVCTCYFHEARMAYPSATVADISAPGPLAEAMLKLFEDDLPLDCQWSHLEEGLILGGIGTLVPDQRTKLSALIRMAKFNPEAAA